MQHGRVNSAIGPFAVPSSSVASATGPAAGGRSEKEFGRPAWRKFTEMGPGARPEDGLILQKADVENADTVARELPLKPFLCEWYGPLSK